MIEYKIEDLGLKTNFNKVYFVATCKNKSLFVPFTFLEIRRRISKTLQFFPLLCCKRCHFFFRVRKHKAAMNSYSLVVYIE